MWGLISVVIPVYNVEQYLHTCIESVCSQTYGNLEILLVDDGSTDSSGYICDAYQNKDARIRVIHKKNGGLSDARNTGLREARGRYVIFIDSDDYIEKTMLEQMMQAVQETGCECAVCAYREFPDGTVLPESEAAMSRNTITGMELTKALYTGKYAQIGFVAWNKLYEKRLFEDYQIEYPVGRIFEDTYTTFKLLYHAQTVTVLNQPLYNYRLRQGSIMRTAMTIEKCRDDIEGGLHGVIYFDRLGDYPLMQLALHNFYRAAIRKYLALSGAERDACRKYICQTYRTVWRRYGYTGKITGKIVFFLFQFFPKLIAKMVALYLSE